MHREHRLVAAEVADGEVGDHVHHREPLGRGRGGAEVLLEHRAHFGCVPVVAARTGHEQPAGAFLHDRIASWKPVANVYFARFVVIESGRQMPALVDVPAPGALSVSERTVSA